MIFKKSPLVFSFVREQSAFLGAMVALLSFLAVLSLGVAIAIGSAVHKWNAAWDLSATIQVMPDGDLAAAQKIINSESARLARVAEVPDEEIRRMLRPWVRDSDALTGYTPKMFELKFKSRGDIAPLSEKIAEVKGARLLRNSEGMRASAAAGWRILMIASFVLALVLGAVGLCISYITRNTALIHKRELDILAQVGAKDKFIARQLTTIIFKRAAAASYAGFLIAVPILLLISGMAAGSKVGLLALLGIPVGGWLALAILPAAITIFAVFITKRTALRLLTE
jgi:cell division transport system permease protein